MFLIKIVIFFYAKNKYNDLKSIKDDLNVELTNLLGI